MDGFDPSICAPPGHLTTPLDEIDRLEWRSGDAPDAATALADFLSAHGLAGEIGSQRGSTSVVLLAGAVACAFLGELPVGAASPIPAVPDLVAVAVRGTGPPVTVPRPTVGEWQPSWTATEHATAVEAVREAIARGDLYQANVVGHRSAPHRGDPRGVAVAVAGIGAAYAGVLTGEGWAVGCASPEQLVRITGRRITTRPIKGTRRIGPGSRNDLRASGKDRAEHVMIVDLERNDLARVAVTGSVDVESLYDIEEWAGLWQAGSTVAAELLPGVGVLDVLRAVLPGGSVTGAPKWAACELLAALEPVGRGPAMGAFGLIGPTGLDLGLTIRTVAADSDRVHLWAGGGITWGSDPLAEVAEAEAKAGPVMQALETLSVA